MSLYSNVTKTDGNVRLISAQNFNWSSKVLRLLAGKFYLFFLMIFYLGWSLLCLFILLPPEMLSFLDVSELQQMVEDRKEQIRFFQLETSSLREENEELKVQLKKAEEDFAEVFQELKRIKSWSSKDTLLLIALLAVVTVCIYFSLPNVEVILQAPVTEKEFVKGLFWQLKCAVSVLWRTNIGELPPFQEQNFSPEDVEWLKAHLKLMVRLARCFTRGLKDPD